MQMTAGDVFDKWTILRMKAQVMPEVKQELKEYEYQAMQMIRPPFLPSLIDLAQANAKIWGLEAEIRNGASVPLEEVGRRALEIRYHNGLRIKAKNEINSYLGEYTEGKTDHLSEDSL